jgi:hypothetical protein
MTEQWKTVPGYEGLYEVSDGGRVRSLLLDRLLSITAHRSGHCSVRLSRKHFYVHALVLTVFVGPRPVRDDGLRTECRHLDGNPSNNALANLRWGTVKENRADRVTLHEVGAFSRADVVNIRWQLSLGCKVKDVAEKYGVDRHTISNIKAGRSYAHVVG